MDGMSPPTEPHAPEAEVVLTRRKFSADDVQVMLTAGILRDGEKVELIGGELIEMAPQGPLHWGLTQKVVSWLLRRLPPDIDLATQGPLRLGRWDEPEPDLFLFPAGMDVNAVRGADVIVAIEIAASSAPYDLRVKRALYAANAVREYWVIEVEARRTHVFRLGAEGFEPAALIAFDTPLSVAGLSLRLADLAP